MTPLVHLLFALSYLLPAGTVALTLPGLVPEAGPVQAALAGIALALVGGLGHEVVSRLLRDRRLEDRLDRLIRSNQDLAAALGRVRTDTEAARAVLDEAGQTVRTQEALLTELRLLREQVGSGAGRVAGAFRSESTQRPPATRGLVPPPGSGGPVFPALAPAAVPPAAAEPAARRPAAPPPPPAAGEAALVELIREALKQNRVDVYLQPIVTLPHRKHRYYEVTSRIRTADGQTLAPPAYLEAARRAGLIGAIDTVLLTRCAQLIRETERRQHQIAFFVNVTGDTVRDPGFMRPFLEFSAGNPALCSKLVLELGQPDLEESGAAAGGLLEQIGRLGVRFSLDRVARFDLDGAELDRQGFRFVKLDCARLMEPLPRLAASETRANLKDRGIEVIVEKIETEAQLADLAEMHLDLGQGQLFGEPRLSRRLT